MLFCWGFPQRKRSSLIISLLPVFARSDLSNGDLPMSYRCGSSTMTTNNKKTKRAQTVPLYCENIRECEMCRRHRIEEIVTGFIKYVAGDDQPWFIGYVYPKEDKSAAERADDVARSIDRAHGFYIRVSQVDRVAFITNQPRRIKDAMPIDIARENLEPVLNDLVQAMPKGGRIRDNSPKKEKQESENTSVVIHAPVKSVNKRMDSAGAEYVGTKNRSTLWKADEAIVESVRASFPKNGNDAPEYEYKPEDDPNISFGFDAPDDVPEQMEIPDLE